MEFARDVLTGKEFPQLATGEGEVIPVPPSLKDRLKALEWLTDRGYGKSTQTVDHTGEVAVNHRLIRLNYPQPKLDEQRPS